MGKALILALALFALSFLPMSSILFVVGTVVGERLLYIPSAAMVAESARAPSYILCQQVQKNGF